MLFLVFEELVEESGISKKILSQVKSLEKIIPNIKLVSYKSKNNYLYRVIENENLYLEKVLNNKINKQLLTCRFTKLIQYILTKNIKTIYIRYNHISNPFFLKFLKKLKKNDIKIILEIPTYPYDGEKINEIGIRKIKNIIEKKYRNYLYKYVDRVVTFSEDNEIFGIKTIKISNGIDIEKISLVQKKQSRNLNEINFIGVAGLAFYHGYDRFIKAIIEYDKKENRNIKFHIVGIGDVQVFTSLKDIVKKNNIEDRIIFYGAKNLKELEEIYKNKDICIGSLGRHRSGLETMRALKNREYCAKGLPMIFSEDDPDFRNLPFVYKVTPDEKLINIHSIIEWYEDLKIEAQDIRKYSEQFSWDIQMKKIIEEIEKI